MKVKIVERKFKLEAAQRQSDISFIIFDPSNSGGSNQYYIKSFDITCVRKQQYFINMGCAESHEV